MLPGKWLVGMKPWPTRALFFQPAPVSQKKKSFMANATTTQSLVFTHRHETDSAYAVVFVAFVFLSGVMCLSLRSARPTDSLY